LESVKLKHSELKAKLLSDPETKAAYDALEFEFTLLSQILRARKQAALTQADIAKHMGTKASAIARLESSLGSKKHSPSLATLRKYAEAAECELKITLVKKEPTDCE